MAADAGTTPAANFRITEYVLRGVILRLVLQDHSAFTGNGRRAGRIAHHGIHKFSAAGDRSGHSAIADGKRRHRIAAHHHLLASAYQAADGIGGCGDLKRHVLHPAADDLRGVLGVIGSGEAQQTASQTVTGAGCPDDSATYRAIPDLRGTPLLTNSGDQHDESGDDSRANDPYQR